MSHIRKHSSEHRIKNIDELNRESLSGLRNVSERLPLFGSDYTQFLNDKIIQVTDPGTPGEPQISGIASDNDYLYIANGYYTNGGGVKKVEKTDITTILASRTVPVDRGTARIIVVDNFVYVTEENYLVKLNKSDLSFVVELDIGSSSIYTLLTDGSYIYAIPANDDPAIIHKIDLTTFTEVATLPLSNGYCWAGAIGGGFIFAETESAGEVISKIDLTTFTEVATQAFPSYGFFWDMTVLGSFLYGTITDASYSGNFVAKIDFDLTEIAVTPTIAETTYWSISNDGTNVYYYPDNKVIKIDTDLVEIENVSLSLGNNLWSSLADTNNLFVGSNYEYKLTKLTKSSISIVQQDIKPLPIPDSDLNSYSTGSCDGEFIYAFTQVKIHKIDIEKSEDAQSVSFPSGFNPRSLAIDNENIYLSGSDIVGNQALRKYDKNTLEFIDELVIDASGRSIDDVAMGADFVYVTASDSWSPQSAQVLKVEKSSFTVVGTFDTGDTDYSQTIGVCVGKTYIYLLMRMRTSNNKSVLIRIDPEAMTEAGSKVECAVASRAMVRPLYDGKYIYYSHRNWSIYKVDGDTMTLTQSIQSEAGDGYGETALTVTDNFIYHVIRKSGKAKILKYSVLDGSKVDEQYSINSMIGIAEPGASILINKQFLVYYSYEQGLHRLYINDNKIYGGKGSKSVTVLVAASDASAAVKTGADYVCDGVNDEVQLNAAIADLKAGVGGRIMLSEGTFNLADYLSQFNGASNIILEGQGVATILNLNIPSYFAFDMTGANNNVLQNFQIINVTTQSAIKTDGVHNIFNNLRIVGIIGSASEASIYIVGGSTRDNIVSNCRFFGAGYGVRFRGIENIANNNICLLQWYNGIVIEDATSIENIVTNNFVRDCNGVGIEISLGLYNIIKGNQIKNSNVMNIRSTGDYNIIVGNLVRGTGISNTGVNDEVGHNIETA